MKHFISMLAASAVLIFSPLTQAEPTPRANNPMSAIQPDSQAKAIQVEKENSEFHITLDSNPTTGYSWFLLADNFESDLIKPIRHEFIQPEPSHKVGAGGQEVWTFKAQSEAFIVPHFIPVTFIYARPWDIEDAVKKTFYIATF